MRSSRSARSAIDETRRSCCHSAVNARKASNLRPPSEPNERRRAQKRTRSSARTLADLDGAADVARVHVAEALSYRRIAIAR